MKLFLSLPIIFSFFTLSGQTDIKPAFFPDTTGRSTQLRVDMSEIPVTAYRNEGKLKSVAGSVSVISSDRLENSAANIASSLLTVPGIVMQEGTLGTIKLTLRGIGSRYPYGTKKIKVFFADIPLYSAEGETTFDDINPEYLDKIEVLRGPASSIHGASLGGTIILYPRRATYNHEELKLFTSAGSYGLLKNAVSYGHGTAGNDLLLSISHTHSDGFRENSNYSRNSFFVNQHHRFRQGLSGNLLVSGSIIRSQIPSSIDSLSFANHPDRAAANWLKTKGYEHPDRIFAGYGLDFKSYKNWQYTTSAFLSYRRTEENRPFNYLNDSGLAYGARVLGQHSKIRGNTNFGFMAGSNLFFENIGSSLTANIAGNGLKGELIQKGKETIYQTDFFAQLETRWNRIALTTGFNFNLSGFRFTDQFTADTLQQSGNYHFKSILAPRISVSWNPFSTLHLYTSVNKGFSIPSLSETLSPLGLINRTIKPEKAWSFEQGLRVTLFERATFIDIAWYYMRVTDLIVPERVAEDVYIGMNAGASLHRGVEIAFQHFIVGHKINDPDALSLVANLSYAASRFNFQNFTAANVDYSGNRLPGMPDQVFTGNLDLKTSHGFYSRLELNTSGRIPINDLNSRYTQPWIVLNFKAGTVFVLFKSLHMDMSLNIHNITDEKYASMIVVNAPGSASSPPRYYYPGLPRWFSGTILLSLPDLKKW